MHLEISFRVRVCWFWSSSSSPACKQALPARAHHSRRSDQSWPEHVCCQYCALATKFLYCICMLTNKCQKINMRNTNRFSSTNSKQGSELKASMCNCRSPALCFSLTTTTKTATLRTITNTTTTQLPKKPHNGPQQLGLMHLTQFNLSHEAYITHRICWTSSACLIFSTWLKKSSPMSQMSGPACHCSQSTRLRPHPISAQ